MQLVVRGALDGTISRSLLSLLCYVPVLLSLARSLCIVFVLARFLFFFFFFSSRRRHTRCGRDWSSDVCSSDLTFPGRRPCATRPRPPAARVCRSSSVYFLRILDHRLHRHPAPVVELLEKADRKSTRLNSSHVRISYAVFCLKKKKN